MHPSSFSEALSKRFDMARHGWKRDACTYLGIARPTLDRYLALERDGKVALIPEAIWIQLKAGAAEEPAQSGTALATPYAMVNSLAAGLCSLQEHIDRNGHIQAPYASTLVRGLNLACALNLAHDRNYPTSLAELLKAASSPLYTWCMHYEGDRAEEFGTAILIRDGEITSECLQLAGLHDVDPEHVFYQALMTACSELEPTDAQNLYVAWRRTVIEQPVVDGFTTFLSNAVLRRHLRLTQGLAEVFYEEVPPLHSTDGKIAVCQLSGTRLRRLNNEWASDSRDPRAARLIRDNGPLWRPHLPRMQELKRSARLFWALPGIEEIALYHKAKDLGYHCELWPKLDSIDLLIKHPNKNVRFAVDLKEHRSPVSLARTFDGFKAFKRHRQMLVVPDYLVDLNPSYYQQFERARQAKLKSPVNLLSVSQFTRLLEDER